MYACTDFIKKIEFSFVLIKFGSKIDFYQLGKNSLFFYYIIFIHGNIYCQYLLDSYINCATCNIFVVVNMIPMPILF